MSRRDQDRDRGDRSSRAQQQAAARTNEYFVPKDGIDREVITADICRYLGNDALVRPGNYENPQTRVVQPGYFITAYRNLTTAMIADLKADSERWEAERRQTASRGQPQNVEYRSSTTHQSRQYYGPTEATAPVAGGYPSAGYAAATPGAQQQGVYDSSQYSSTYANQPAPGGYAASTSQGYGAPDNYYVAGANMVVDPQRPDRAAVQQAGAIPRTGTMQYSSTNTYQQPVDSRYYTQPSPSQNTAASGYQQPADPFYGRAPVAAGTYDSPTSDMYDNRAYQDTQAYSQPPVSAAPTTTSGSSRRDRDRDTDRDRHHRSRR